MLEQTQSVTGRAINNISRLLAPRPRASGYARSYGNSSMQPAGVICRHTIRLTFWCGPQPPLLPTACMLGTSGCKLPPC